MAVGILVFTVMGVLLVVALVVGVVIAATGVSRRGHAERRAAFAGLAAQRGWTYHESWDGLQARFPGEPFSSGYDRRVSHAIEGSYAGRSFVAFDFRSTESTSSTDGSSSTTTTYAVVALHLGCTAPMLQIRPTGRVGQFFASMFGADFEIGDPVFDERVLLSTTSREFAHEVLTPAMRGVLLSIPGRTFRFQDDSLLVITTGTQPVGQLDASLAAGCAVLDAVPTHVWERLHGDTRRDG